MHHLMLLRHAKSTSEEAGIVDRNRPLSRRGKRTAVAMGQALSKLDLIPSLILVSPARRTMQTLAALAPLPANARIETPETLYLAEAQILLAQLRALSERETSVLVIGHNPGLHELAQVLAQTNSDSPEVQRLAQSLPTAGFVEFALTGKWAELDSRSAKLVRLMLPRDLADLAQ